MSLVALDRMSSSSSYSSVSGTNVQDGEQSRISTCERSVVNCGRERTVEIVRMTTFDGTVQGSYISENTGVYGSWVHE